MKNFEHWSDKKIKLEFDKKERPVKLREIWWVAVGQNVGFEQNGKNSGFERPVLVFKVFNKNMFLGIPLTSGNKNRKSKYYFSIKDKNKEYFLILPQIRLLSTKRVLRRIRKVEVEEFLEIKKSLKDLLGM